jgi:cobalamin biosynthesis protein CobT
MFRPSRTVLDHATRLIQLHYRVYRARFDSICHANTVSNNVEIDRFDSTGLLAGGFYLDTDEGPLGAGVYSDFEFRPSATAAAPEPATWSMMMIGFGFLAAASWRNARQRRS